MSVSLRENITAVIESCFSETKEEIQEVAINNILELIRNNTADRKTEPTCSKMEQVEDEPQTEEPPMDEYYKDHDEFYEPQERSSE